MINTINRKHNQLLDEALVAQKAEENRNNIIPRKPVKVNKEYEAWLDKYIIKEGESYEY